MLFKLLIIPLYWFACTNDLTSPSLCTKLPTSTCKIDQYRVNHRCKIQVRYVWWDDLRAELLSSSGPQTLFRKNAVIRLPHAASGSLLSEFSGDIFAAWPCFLPFPNCLISAAAVVAVCIAPPVELMPSVGQAHRWEPERNWRRRWAVPAAVQAGWGAVRVRCLGMGAQGRAGLCSNVSGDVGWDQPTLLPVSSLRAGEVFIRFLGLEKVRGLAWRLWVRIKQNKDSMWVACVHVSL